MNSLRCVILVYSWASITKWGGEDPFEAMVALILRGVGAASF